MMFDVAMYGLMMGAGETYFTPFALEIGVGPATAGLIATVPYLGGALLQLISPRGVDWVGSYRRWVVLCAFLQALAFVPLIVGGMLGAMPTWLIFVIATIYWGAALGSGPAWTTWVGTLVPKPIQARFFAKHARMVQFTIIFAILVAGLALEFGRAYGVALEVFALCFLCAGSARFYSARALARQSEPLRPAETGHRPLPIKEIVRRFIPHRRANPVDSAIRPAADSDRWEGRVILYFLVMMAAIQIANPFITPFILEELETGYAYFTVLFAVVFVAKAVALPFWGSIAKKYGPKRLLWIGGSVVIPLPALWMVSSSFPYLIVLQIITGAAAAAYELGIFLLFFETIHVRDRTSILTLFNLANALAGIGGSLLGGFLLHQLGEAQFAYYTIFVVSTAARALALIFLAQLSGIKLVPMPMIIRVLGVRIGLGSIDRPLLPNELDTKDDEEPD